MKNKAQRNLVQPFMSRGWTEEQRTTHVHLVCPLCPTSVAIPTEARGRSHRNTRARLLRHERSHEIQP